MGASRKSYQSLCTEFYDTDKPMADDKEIDFYYKQLQHAKKPILEAMCGSGRLMIPLLKKGLEIEGIDYSHEMLASLKIRLSANNLKAHIYEGNILDTNLHKKYGAIFVAVGSFQLIIDLQEAFTLLQKFNQLLLPNGLFILDAFIPWEALSKNEESDISQKSVQIDKHTRIDIHSNSMVDVKKQVYYAKNIYKKYVDNELVNEEYENLPVRWYYEHELQLFLEKAGFKDVKCIRNEFKHNPDAYTFIGVA